MAFDVNRLFESENEKNKQREMNVDIADLLDNAAVRVPICLCLDTSGSMANNNKIDDLNSGIKDFIQFLLEDEVAKDSAELCIIQMGGDTPKMICDFEPLYKVIQHPEIGNFRPMGRTPMGQAVEMGIRALNERKARYKATATDYYQPWLVIMSDGVSTDPAELMDEAQRFVLSLIASKKLVSIPVVIGENADGHKQLAGFSENEGAFTLNALKIKEFFKYLSSSVSRVSSSNSAMQVNPVEEIKQRAAGIIAWESATRYLK